MSQLTKPTLRTFSSQAEAEDYIRQYVAEEEAKDEEQRAKLASLYPEGYSLQVRNANNVAVTRDQIAGTLEAKENVRKAYVALNEFVNKAIFHYNNNLPPLVPCDADTFYSVVINLSGNYTVLCDFQRTIIDEFGYRIADDNRIRKFVAEFVVDNIFYAAQRDMTRGNTARDHTEYNYSVARNKAHRYIGRDGSSRPWVGLNLNPQSGGVIDLFTKVDSSTCSAASTILPDDERIRFYRRCKQADRSMLPALNNVNIPDVPGYMGSRDYVPPPDRGDVISIRDSAALMAKTEKRVRPLCNARDPLAVAPPQVVPEIHVPKLSRSPVMLNQLNQLNPQIPQVQQTPQLFGNVNQSMAQQPAILNMQGTGVTIDDGFNFFHGTGNTQLDQQIVRFYCDNVSQKFGYGNIISYILQNLNDAPNFCAAARAFYSNPTCMDNLVNISYNKSIDTMKAESYRYAEYAIAVYAQGGSRDDCYAAIVTSAELMFLTCLIEQAPNYLGNTTYRIYMMRKYGANNSLFNGGNGVSQPFGGITGNTVFGGPNAHPSVNNLFTGNLPGFNSATTTQSNARIVSAEQMVNAASGVGSPAQPIMPIMMPAVTPTNEAPIVPAAPVIVSAQGEPITSTQSPVLPQQTVVTQPATVAAPNQPTAVQAQPQVVESAEDDEARELKIYKTVGTPLIRDLLTNILDTVDTNGECVPFTTITEAESRRFEIHPRKLFGNAVEYLAPRSADGTSSFGYSRDYDDFINSVFRVRTPGMPLSYILYNRVYSGMIGYAKDADSANILLLGIRGPEVTNTGKYDFGFNINDSKIRTHESSYHMWNWDLCTVPYISNIHEVSKDRLKTILLENGVPVVDVLTKIADRVVAAAFNQSGEAGSSIITHEEYQLYLSNSYASVYGSRIIQYINRVLLRAECGYGFGEWLARTHKDAETVRILHTYFGEDIVANKQPLVDEAAIVESVEPAMTVQDQRDLDTNVAQAFTAAKIVDPAELVLSTVKNKTQPAPQPASVVSTPATVVPTVTDMFAPTPAVAEPEPEVTTKTVCYSNPLEVPPYPETCEDPKAQRIAKQVSVLLGDKSLFDETRPLGDYLDEASAMGIDISELASAPIRDMKGYNRRIEMVRGAILGCKIRSTLPVEQYYGSVRHDLVSNETPIDFLEQQRICDEKGIKWQIPANTKCTFWYRDPMDGRATDNPPLYTPAWANRNMAAAAKYGIIRKQLARYEQDAIRMQECFATGEEYIPSLPVSVDTGYVPSDYKYKEKYSTKFDEYGTRHVVEIATVNECVIDNIVAHPLFMSDGIRFNEYAPTRPKVRKVEPAAPAVAPVEAKPAITVTPMPVPPVVGGDCPSCQQDSSQVADTPVEVKEEAHLSMLERDSLEYQRTNPEEYARLVAEAEAATNASAAEEAARMEAERKALEEDEREFYRQAIAAAEEVDMEVAEEAEEEEEYPVTKDVPYKTSANFSLIQKIADHYNLKCSDVVPDEKLGVPTMPIIYNEERGVPASHRPVYFDKDDIRDANTVEWEMCQPPVKDTELVDGEDGKEIRTNFKSFYTIDECYMAKLDNNRKMRVTSVRITDPMLDHQAAIEAIKECEPQLFKTGDDGIENSCMITYDEVKVFKGNFQAMRKLIEDVREILWDDNIGELDASGACIVCACEMIKACPDESVRDHISSIIIDRFNEAARVSLAHMVIDNDTDSKVNTYFKAESLDDIIFLSNQTFNVTSSSIWSSGVSDDFVGAFTTCTLYAFGAIWWRGYTVPVALRPKAGDRTFKPYLDSSRFNEDKFFILTSPEANIRVGRKGNISGLTIAMNMEEVKDKNRTTVKYRNLSKEQIAQLNDQLANVCALRVEHHVFVHTLDDIPAKVTSDQTEYVNKFSAVQFLYNLYKKFSVYASVNLHYYGEHVVKPVIVGIDVDRNVAAYQGAPQLSR